MKKETKDKIIIEPSPKKGIHQVRFESEIPPTKYQLIQAENGRIYYSEKVIEMMLKKGLLKDRYAL